MDIFSDIGNGLGNIYNGIVGIAGDLAGLVISIPQMLADAVFTIIDVILYPIIGLFTTLIGIITDFAAHILAPIEAITNFISSFQAIIMVVLEHSLDATWIAIIGSGFAFIIAVRLYHYAKDVEILGFKL